jgi:hypothetical protein
MTGEHHEGTRLSRTGVKAWEDVARPALDADTDAIVQVDTTTICGTDLHVLKGDLPAMVDGRIHRPRSGRHGRRDRRRGEERDRFAADLRQFMQAAAVLTGAPAPTKTNSAVARHIAPTGLLGDSAGGPGRASVEEEPMGSRRPDAVTGMAVDRRVRHTPAGDPWLV